jgi:hypothetical protein
VQTFEANLEQCQAWYTFSSTNRTKVHMIANAAVATPIDGQLNKIAAAQLAIGSLDWPAMSLLELQFDVLPARSYSVHQEYGKRPYCFAAGTCSAKLTSLEANLQ